MLHREKTSAYLPFVDYGDFWILGLALVGNREKIVENGGASTFTKGATASWRSRQKQE